MSERSFRSPQTTRSESVTFTDTSSLPPHSHGRKIRLRIVTRDPLPGLQFLAPFNYDDREAFGKLQHFICNYLIAKGKAKGTQWEEDLVLMVDGFEVPFDDPDILRDGDVVEVRLHQQADTGSVQEKTEMEEESADEQGDSIDDSSEEEDDDDEEEQQETLTQAQNEEEKQAILEATRLAALFRAGIHTSTSADQDEAQLSSAVRRREGVEEELPKMPNLPSAATSSFPTMPAMPFPLMSGGGGGGGAAAALAAFELKRNQMRSPTVERVPVRNAVAGPWKVKKRARSESSSSSSSSSSSESSTDSDSSSSTDDNSITSSDDSDSSSDSHSSSSSASAPSEHRFVSNRHRSPATQAGPSHEADLVPPGAGTSRTKRRNAMRREKLRLQREAANLAAFNQAKARTTSAAAQQGWVEDRQPIPISHVEEGNRLPSSISTTVRGLGLGLPPGGGSLDLTPALQNQSRRGKRKRHTTPSPTKEMNLTVDTSKEATPPYGGEIPKRMSIRHVDCQTYYDREVDKLEVEFKAEGETMYRDVPAQSSHSPPEGGPQKKARVNPTPPCNTFTLPTSACSARLDDQESARWEAITSCSENFRFETRNIERSTEL